MLLNQVHPLISSGSSKQTETVVSSGGQEVTGNAEGECPAVSTLGCNRAPSGCGAGEAQAAIAYSESRESAPRSVDINSRSVKSGSADQIETLKSSCKIQRNNQGFISLHQFEREASCLINKYKYSMLLSAEQLSVIKEAVLSNDVETAIELLEVTAFSVKLEHGNNTLFHIAAKNGFLEIIKILSEKSGFEVNALNNVDRTALMLASLYGHSCVVRFLLSFPVIDIGHTCANKQSALMLATCKRKSGIYIGHPGLPKAEIDRKYDDIIQLLFDRVTTLHACVLCYSMKLPANTVQMAVPYCDQKRSPCCGLAGMAMVMGYWRSIEQNRLDGVGREQLCFFDKIDQAELDALIEKTRSAGYTSKGEMFIGQFMAKVAEMSGYEAMFYKCESIDALYEMLDKGHPVILPYDKGSSTSTDVKNGYSAHYCVIEGYFLHNDKKYLIGRQSCFFNEHIIWDVKEFERSWLQLIRSRFYGEYPMPVMVLRHLMVTESQKLILAPEPVREESQIEAGFKGLVETGEMIIKDNGYFLADGVDMGIYDTLAGCMIEVFPKNGG